MAAVLTELRGEGLTHSGLSSLTAHPAAPQLFARGQSCKAVRDAHGREAFFEGIVAGIAQRQLLEGEAEGEDR